MNSSSTYLFEEISLEQIFLFEEILLNCSTFPPNFSHFFDILGRQYVGITRLNVNTFLAYGWYTHYTRLYQPRSTWQ